jgi:hypothetical protein
MSREFHFSAYFPNIQSQRLPNSLRPGTLGALCAPSFHAIKAGEKRFRARRRP